MSTKISSSTNPAPFFRAFGTMHMVTSTNFLCSKSTMWTFLDIISTDILSQLGILVIPITSTWMCNFSAFKAHSLTTCAHRFIVPTAATLFLTFYIVDTTRPRAPFEIWIQFYINILFEFQILFINFFTSKILNIIKCKGLITLILHTLNLQYTSIIDFRF